ncbi:MAM and LDL-receptor class A domain-containing protein 1-like [Uloborus diversus]|uniref:MAM and LDL-receptor class A domain-containing protein 1-like n=1 Tax=Uloborus diversus TaxID=327109 RepID=UPI00240987AC|nr:MAM and LDL-receptor class A domain-containing protein 1-like [Uloborus diversus]
MALIRSCCLLVAFLGIFVSAQRQKYKCDFETGLCSFLSNHPNNKVDWKIGKGQQNALDTGPSIDHTYGLANGSYLFVNVSLAKLNTVALQTIVLQDNYCVRFFYHMYGADVGDLMVSAESVSGSISAGSVNYFYRSESQGDRWKEAVFSVTRNSAMQLRGYRVVFTAKHKTYNSVKGDIAIDDVELTAGACPQGRSESTSLCTFDDNVCGYKVSASASDFNWFWSSKQDYRPNYSVYPSGDHTLGTLMGGYFMAYWQGAIWDSSLRTSTLSSPTYKAPKKPNNCLHFYYYMDADGRKLFFETANAYIQAFATTSTPPSRTWILTKAKNATNLHRQWLYAEGEVELKYNFRFDFVAGIESKPAAAFAVDDIKLVPGDCPEAGFYLVLSTVNKEPGWTANLESDLFEPAKETTCLSFFYAMAGEDPGTLKVIRKEENITESTIWVLKDEGRSGWLKGAVPLTPSSLYSQVIFRGIVGTGKYSYMALDDIRIRSGEKCDFTPTDADPRYEGNYIFVSSYDGNQSNSEKVAKIQSPVVSSFYPQPACFSFYYHMFGAHVGELRLFMVPMQDANTALGREIIWRRRGTQPDKWILLQDSLNLTEGDYRLEIEAEGGSGFAGDIAIDHILMSIGACPEKELCDFESGTLCGWTVEPSAKGTFYWQAGADLIKGPDYDHTTNSKLGYYLQAFTQASATVGEETSFVSPTYVGSRWGPHCLTFWYYRPGLGVGKISVTTRRNGKDTIMWTASRDVGQRWHYGQVNINKKSTFQIVFLAEKGRNNDHQMAIDDILILNSQCGNPAQCTFNKDYCSYSLNDTSDFAWLLGTGRVVNSQLIDRPPQDNSVEGGMYVYADMTSPSLAEGQKATLVSEILEFTAQQVTCLSFFYYIQGTDPTSLAVGKMVLNNVEQNMKYQSVDLQSFNKTTTDWTQYTMDVPVPTGESYQVFFSAVRGAKPRAFIAVDDITVREGTCPKPTTEPPILPTEMPGRYAYVQGDDVSEKMANITGPTAEEDWVGKFCFSFWYIMDVEGPNRQS